MRTLSVRLAHDGGDRYGRIRNARLTSLRAALGNTYDSRLIKTPIGECCRALILNEKLSSDYDKKIVAVENDSMLAPGDVFELLDDGTHWMIQLQDLAETAYLRAHIIKCDYNVDINGGRYWVYFKGPDVTSVNWTKHDVMSVNELNMNGTLYVKRDEVTLGIFSRGNTFKLDGHTWEVQATDKFSMPGIIEVVIKETHDSSVSEIPEVLRRDDEFHQIIGPDVVDQDTVAGYEIRGGYLIDGGTWWLSKDSTDHAVIDRVSDDGRFCRVSVAPGAVGEYRVIYGTPEHSYHIDTKVRCGRCQTIFGPETMQPFDTASFSVEDCKGKFYVQSRNAQVISSDERSCKVEVMTGRRCEFTLYFSGEQGESYEKKVVVRPL